MVEGGGEGGFPIVSGGRGVCRVSIGSDPAKQRGSA